MFDLTQTILFKMAEAKAALDRRRQLWSWRAVFTCSALKLGTGNPDSQKPIATAPSDKLRVGNET
jgi:hypothetical protein